MQDQLRTPPSSPRQALGFSFSVPTQGTTPPQARKYRRKGKTHASDSDNSPVKSSSVKHGVSHTTEDQLQQVRQYFATHPDSNKYSRKESNFFMSYIKSDGKIYAIIDTLGAGDFGYVKKIQDIETEEFFAVKIMPGTEKSGWQSERDILAKMELLRGTILRSKNPVAVESSTNGSGSSSDSASASSQGLSSQPLTPPTSPKLSSEFSDMSLFSGAATLATGTDRPAKSLILGQRRTKTQESGWTKKRNSPKAYPPSYDRKAYLVIPYIENSKTLEAYLKLNMPSLTLLKKLEIILKIIHELKIMHANGIVHNDLNPRNILIQQDPTTKAIYAVKVVDYGCARQLNDNKVASTAGVKSDSAPEHLDPLAFLEDITSKQGHPLYNAIGDITVWAAMDEGFCSASSDVYKLSCRINDFNQSFHSEVFLEGLVASMRIESPFQRPSLEEVEAKCLEKCDQLKKEAEKEAEVDVMPEDPAVDFFAYMGGPSTPRAHTTPRTPTTPRAFA